MDTFKKQFVESFIESYLFQLSFRSVSSTVETKRDQVRRILQLPPPSLSSSVSTTSSSQSDNDPTAAKEMEIAITAYLRRATETFDLSKNVEVRVTP